MQDSASRRRVLKNMAAFGAAGTVSSAFASEGQHPANSRKRNPGRKGAHPRVRSPADCREFS
jgi:hypothetical protein